MRKRISIGENVVAIWTMHTDYSLDRQQTILCLDQLAPEERKHHECLLGNAQRQLYLLAHVFLRQVLSRHFDVPPEGWRYEYGPYGRPEISYDRELSSVRFNLSYCRDYVACAVTHDADVGIDVEVTQPIDAIRKTASRYLSKRELDTLASVSNRTYVSRFLTYWTLKEAYLKGCGKGFAIAPNMISLHTEDENAIRVEFDRSLDDDPSLWQFALIRPTPSHTIALAVRRKKSGSFKTVPYSLEPREILKHTV